MELTRADVLSWPDLADLKVRVSGVAALGDDVEYAAMAWDWIRGIGEHPREYVCEIHRRSRVRVQALSSRTNNQWLEVME